MLLFEDEIRRNLRQTVLLLLIFNLLLVGVAWLAGYMIEPMEAYMLAGFAFLYSGASSLSAYLMGPKLALRSVRARPITKEEFPHLHNTLEGLCIAAGLPQVPRLYLVEEEAANAFATGRSPQDAVIAVTSGLVRRLNRQELEGVLAHELAHIYNRDTLVMTISAVLAAAIYIFVRLVWRSLHWGGGSSRSRGKGSGQGNALMLLFALVALVLAPMVAAIIHFAVSRRREYMADATAVSLTRNPEGIASALEKLAVLDNRVHLTSEAYAPLFIATPLSGKELTENLFSTHPPIEERIRKLRGMTPEEWKQYWPERRRLLIAEARRARERAAKERRAGAATARERLEDLLRGTGLPGTTIPSQKLPLPGLPLPPTAGPGSGGG